MINKLGQEPAFPPSKITQELCPTCEGYHVGMSKRFYAACAAMQGLLSNPDADTIGLNEKQVVSIAYQYADELLKQEEV